MNCLPIKILIVFITPHLISCQNVLFLRQLGDPNTRLGLLAEMLGVEPVPGASNNLGGPNLVGGRESVDGTTCGCLPLNQKCSAIDLRIVNTPGTTSGCPQGTKPCCQDFGIPVQPNPPQSTGSPVRPPPHPSLPGNPVIRPVNPTQSNQLGTCGISNPLFLFPPEPATAEFGEYPWMVLVLGMDDTYYGGGVLVAENLVLTAAHKIAGKSNMKVRLGDYDVQKVQDHNNYIHVEIPVTQIIIHPQFESNSVRNDVAILRLARPVGSSNFPHIGPACLPAQGQLFTGQRCLVTGWGRDAFRTGKFQERLKEVDVPVLDGFRCEQLLKKTRLGSSFSLDQKSFICAGAEAGKDACTGDGGSPLVCAQNGQWIVAGLVAWGIGCAQNDVPGVYVNVASYSNFIQEKIRQLSSS